MKGKIVLVITCLLLFSSIINVSGTALAVDFDVHEWGIFEKEYGCNETSALNEPIYEAEVDKPVIYFHSEEDLTDVTVTVESISNTVTIPYTPNINNSISWSVNITNNLIGGSLPYLFYEGIINSPPSIEANITTDNETMTCYVKNIDNFTIRDIIFVYGYISNSENTHRNVGFVHIDEIQPDEEFTAVHTLSDNPVYDTNPLLTSLIEQGLTESEAQELIDYWEHEWFYPDETPFFTRILYTIPQSTYDELLPLSINPQPNNTVRVGVYMITDIPVIWNDAETMPGFGFVDISIAVIIGVVLISVFKKKR